MKTEQLNKQKYYIPLIILIVMFILTIFITVIYLDYIENLITENTYKNLGELTKLDVSRLKQTMEDHKSILETIVNNIEENKPKTEKEIFDIYELNSGKEKFSRIAILYGNGKTSTSDGEVVDLSLDVDEFFSTEDIQISKSRKSKVDEQEINIYSKKIEWKGQDVVILLVVETDKFEEVFSQSMFNGKGAEYIITNDGEIIVNSRKEKNGNNIFNELNNNAFNINKNNIDNLQILKNNVKNKKNAQIKYEINGQNHYIAYQNLGINDWNLLIITSGNVIAEELNQILNLTFLSSIIIIIIILIIAIYIIISNINKRKKLYKLAYVDPITNLGNKNYFILKGNDLLSEYQHNLYIIVLDVDKFKWFNKKYGYEIGRKLLNKIGENLNNILNKNSIICRLSNDIFGILIETKENIIDIIKKMEKELNFIKIDNNEYRIYISIGLYKIEDNEKEVENVLDKALIAHSSVKGNYNVQYKVFDEKMEEKLEKEHEIELVMEEALKNNEFKIYYQPKISTKSEKSEEAEALVRWKRNGKVIQPNEFIPVFEKNQFIVKLDKYIFEKVCQDLLEWKYKYNKIPVVSVNVSKENFIISDFIKDYVEIVRKYGLQTKQIEIEITESAAIDESIDIVKIINNIKTEGFKISIDDFGTGYSSLNMLQNMFIDTLKIDKSFIDKINVSKNEYQVIQFILLLARKLNLKTVAEGVETREQLEFLKKYKCDLIQGYYYSKPLDKISFEKYFFMKTNE